MIYLIFFNGLGMKIINFYTERDLVSFLRHNPPLQYVVIRGEYIESNL